MPIIYVEIIHIAVGFDNFEYKRLISNEVRVFDSIFQSGMRIFSNNILAIKTKCENTVPMFYVKIIHIGLGFDDSNVCLTLRSMPWKKAAASIAKTLQEEVNLFDKEHLKYLKRHFEEVKGESIFNPLDYKDKR